VQKAGLADALEPWELRPLYWMAWRRTCPPIDGDLLVGAATAAKDPATIAAVVAGLIGDPAPNAVEQLTALHAVHAAFLFHQIRIYSLEI
jgi:hypothetical protein